MPKIRIIDFRAVKAAITMKQVIEHYGVLDQFKRSGDNLSGPCPIHKGINPTQFRISISKNIWNCFSECKHGGNTLDFIARMEKCSIHAAALLAIEWFQLDSEAMKGEPGDEAEQSASESSTESGVPRTKTTTKLITTPEPILPNRPLKFRLDKLQQDHPYLAERGLPGQPLLTISAGR